MLSKYSSREGSGELKSAASRLYPSRLETALFQFFGNHYLYCPTYNRLLYRLGGRIFFVA